MLKPEPFITFTVNVKDFHKNPNQCEHNLIDILMVALCCIMSNGETWEDMESYGNKKFRRLRIFLELPDGTPLQDTFYRVFTHLNAASFQKCFISWIKSAFPNELCIWLAPEVIGLD